MTVQVTLAAEIQLVRVPEKNLKTVAEIHVLNNVLVQNICCFNVAVVTKLGNAKHDLDLNFTTMT